MEINNLSDLNSLRSAPQLSEIKIKKLLEDDKYSQIFRLLKRTKEIRNIIIKKRI